MNTSVKQKMDVLLKDKEWTPNIDSSNWEKHNKGYYTYTDIPKIKYIIDKQLIDDMKMYNTLYKQLKSYVPPFKQSSIAKIFSITQSNQKPIYAYTTMSILYYIKSNLHRYLRKEKSAFNGKNIDELTIEVIMVVKNATKIDLNTIKRSLHTTSKLNNLNIDDVLIYYEKIIKDIEVPKHTGYIYRIYRDDNQKSYIGASNKRLDNISLERVIQQHKNLHKHREQGVEFSIEIIVKVKYSLVIGLYILIDKYIKEYDSIDNGYNENYRYIDRLLNSNNYKLILQKDILDAIDNMYDK